MSAPTLVVRGERDPLVSRTWTERVAALLPRGELAVVAGQARPLNYSAPAEFAGLLRRHFGLGGE